MIFYLFFCQKVKCRIDKKRKGFVNNYERTKKGKRCIGTKRHKQENAKIRRVLCSGIDTGSIFADISVLADFIADSAQL